ncbi:MAG: hydroxyacylglutathione hydrolase [Proteobacteria bacterium]|nr:MAG: hydroxyacylglutathione hydrolase [Pseudomonadota bacterium]
MTIQVTPIKAFTDNYIWAIHDNQHCYVVDPGQAEPVNQFIADKQLSLSGILITHHHNDHVGGMVSLQQRHQVPAWGPDDDRINGELQVVTEQNQVDLQALSVCLQVLFIPGHTISHIAFYNNDWLFCGDALFSLGCGRMFEGHPAMFVESLNKIKALPEHLAVYCGHEYTQDNCRFARALEPDSQALMEFCQQIKKLRAQQKPSLPSRLSTELKLNPFLRTADNDYQKLVQNHLKTPINDAITCFAALRQWKDNF